MKKLRSVLSFGVAVAMICAGFSGCSSKEAVKSGNASVPEGVKLTLYAQNDFDTSETPTLADVKCNQEIMKETGVKVDFQSPAAGTDANEQFNLLIASGKLPDIISWHWDALPGGISKYIQSDTIIKLNDLLQDNGKNYTAALDKYPEIKKEATLDDGIIPAFYRLDPDQRRLAYAGFGLRGDWLKKLNLTAPATMDDWHKVLTAFKTQDPNGNGKADEIPWVQTKGPGPTYVNFASAYGILDGMYKDLDTGKVKFGPIDPGYKDFITTMAQWYKEGLIDPDFATSDANAFNAKIQNSIGGATYFGGIGGAVGGNITTARAQTPDFTLVGVNNPKGSDGKSHSSTGNIVSNVSGGCAITSSCKYPAAAAKFLDYYYSEKGQLLTSWGIEGESYTSVNGKNTFTDAIMHDPNGKAPQAAASHYCFATVASASRVMEYEPWAQLTLIMPEQKQCSDTWSKDDAALLIPPLQFTTDESSQLSDIMNNVNTYQQEEELKFILGAEPLSNLDSFVEKLKNMDVEQAVKIYQQSLDRLNARK